MFKHDKNIRETNHLDIRVNYFIYDHAKLLFANDTLAEMQTSTQDMSKS